jgi:hypothetical protein
MTEETPSQKRTKQNRSETLKKEHCSLPLAWRVPCTKFHAIVVMRAIPVDGLKLTFSPVAARRSSTYSFLD